MEGLNDIAFPNLGLYFKNVPSGFSIGDFEIKIYGIIIVLGFLLAYFMSQREAKRTDQNPDDYVDCFLAFVIPAIIGARLYYVIFSWDSYKNDLLSIFNIRQGGLGIYGGVLAGVLAIYIFAKVKKLSFPLILDTLAPMLVLGQCLGRWGNFFNREAFGGNDSGLFTMRLPADYVYISYSDAVKRINVSDGFDYIDVQPTFLYESTLCLLIFIILLVFRRHKKVDGEVFLLYACLYGIGRFVIEGFRTDQLILCSLGSIDIPVSQVVAVAFILLSLILFVRGRIKKSVEFYTADDEEENEVSEVKTEE
ncbi:MAG: prolipoprotein diacylglyceryl transferase [Lachnospiraceae bacterium]|nr:prolipoprotein diacylglyceryl transferase [Lachnospiraceae bacterium]